MPLLTVLFTILTAYAEPPAPSKSCVVRGGVPSYMMSHPDRLRVWMDSNAAKIKDVGDLICCLPEAYRQNFIVAPVSHAAQNGMPDSPRVILMNPLPEADFVAGRGARIAVTMMMSINGGSPDLNQANSLEMMFNNPRTQQAEYYDLEFGRTQGNPRAGAPSRAHLSGRNPAECMGCHGHNGSAPALGGARMIFDPPLRWPRFIGGTLRCNPSEDAVMDRIESAAIEAVRTNPRYRCLNIPGNTERFIQDQRVLLNRVDAQTESINLRRISTLARNTPEWRKVLPAILASENCAKRSLREFAEYIPESAWSKFSDTTTIRSTLRSGSEILPAYRRDLELQRRFDDGTRAQQRAWLEKPNLSRPPALGENAVACESRGAQSASPEPDTVDDPEASSRRQGGDANSKNAGRIEQDLSGRDVLDRYSLDTHLEAFRFQSGTNTFDPAVRFLFEARGIPVDSWGTDSVGARYRRDLPLASTLASQLPANDRLRQIQEAFEKIRRVSVEREPDEEAGERSEKLCAELKTLSHAALATITGPSGPAPAASRPSTSR